MTGTGFGKTFWHFVLLRHLGPHRLKIIGGYIPAIRVVGPKPKIYFFFFARQEPPLFVAFRVFDPLQYCVCSMFFWMPVLGCGYEGVALGIDFRKVSDAIHEAVQNLRSLLEGRNKVGKTYGRF